MASIRSFTEDGAAFDSEATGALSKAFAEVCEALAVKPDQSRDREVIAVRIIELARRGLIDAEALSARVVAEAETRRRS